MAHATKGQLAARETARGGADDRGRPAKQALPSPSEHARLVATKPEAIVLEGYEGRGSALFTADPRVVVFRDFEPGGTYRAGLTVRNTSPVPHQLRLASSDSVCFAVAAARGSSPSGRLAAGMARAYEVQFRPDERRDYLHDVEFAAETERFAVPVVAVGPRALLSFPDELRTEPTAVKVARLEPVLLRNVGDAPTGFSVYTDEYGARERRRGAPRPARIKQPSVPRSSRFAVSPPRGHLEPGRAKRLLVEFLAARPGRASARLFLRCDEGARCPGPCAAPRLSPRRRSVSGPTLRSLLHGEAAECDAGLARERLAMKDTYLGLSRLATVEIRNDSEFALAAEWARHASAEEDAREMERRLLETPPDLLPSDDESIAPEARELVRQRVLSDAAEALARESLPFDHADFAVRPLRLQAPPRSATTVTFAFRPTRVGDVEACAYLELAGLENRARLSLSGKCLGPALRLNVLSLDIQTVYLCSTYNYEIVCENFGPIPGTLVYVEKRADFGSTITVEPSEAKVDVGELKPLILSFCSDRTGEFVERVDFAIKESSDRLSFVLKGRVICPLVKIRSSELNFGAASVGFTTKRKLWIKNLSHESVHFELEVPSDGHESAVSYLDFSRALTKPTLPRCPREFHASPSEGCIEPESCLCIEVRYTPNVARSGVTQLLVNACRSLCARPLVVPVSYDARRAAFEVSPAAIHVRFCFVNFPYCRTLTIANTSEAHGYFHFVPQEVSADDEVLYSLSTYQGHLAPGRCAEITLTVIVQEIGEHKVDLHLFGLGFETPVKCCEITGHGEGPVASAEPSRLNWGEIRVLQKRSLDLKLTNDSPISARFTVTVNKHKSIWNAEPSSGELSPYESITLKVGAFLRDTGKFSDRLSVTIFNGQTINVGLSAVGVGCCIVFEPPIFPELNIGCQFSRQDVCVPIIAKNEGTRSQHLLLTNVERPRQAKKAPAEESKSSLFSIEPSEIEALPGSSQKIHCKIRWNANETVEEQWYLHARIEGQAKRELLGSSLFTATFTEPDVSFDKGELAFRLDFAHDRESIRQLDEIVVTNRSGRDLSARFTVDFPFRIVEERNCHTDRVAATLRNDRPLGLRVYFPYSGACAEPSPKVFEGLLTVEYDEHKQIDKIPCRAEVNYPHLTIVPEEVNLYCPTGQVAEERVRFANDTGVPVIFKIEWLRDTFSCRSLSSMAEGESEGSSDTHKSASTASSPKSGRLDGIPASSWWLEDAREGAEEAPSVSEQEQPSTDQLDRFLRVSPQEGHVPPRSEGYLTFTFHGFQRTRVAARCVCRAERGSATVLSVRAIADDVRCELQSEALDFGLGLFCEPATAALSLCNRCAIPLAWTLDSSSECLTLVDGPAVLAPDAESAIRVRRSPTAPGLFSEKIVLDVAYLEPYVIDVRWLATMPQVYLDAARDREFERQPAGYGYEAVRMLAAERATRDDRFVETAARSPDERDAVASDETEFGAREWTRLIEDGWQIVSRSDNYPSRIDIDMAFERRLAKSYLEAASTAVAAPTYTIDVGCVIVEQQSARLTVPLNNYGYEKAKVALKSVNKVRKPSETCFHVELDRNTEICQCESALLSVAFRPRRKIFTRARTDASYKFQLEVKHGLTIPVVVKAAAVYPHVAVNLENLDFGKVFVGQCRRMSLTLKNDGFVDCHWLISLANASDAPKKCEEDPFYVGRANDRFAPGQEETLYAYFRPSRNGIQKFNLTITVLNGLEAITIGLTGCGIERRILINRTKIKCSPVVPNVNVAENYFTIKNLNSYPIEVYWDHLADFSRSNRIVRLLNHYYGTYEVLIPERKLGDAMLSIFQDFYDKLICQMCTDQQFKPIVEEWLGLDNGSMNGSEKSGKAKKDKSVADLKRLNAKQLVDKNESEKLITAVTMRDPEEVKFLLAEYTSRLKERPNYMEGNDPLGELYRLTDKESQTDAAANEPEERAKNLIVIFYGPSFTEPQETACRVAKTLKLPLVNLNQVFLEAVASSLTDSAKKLADQLDHRYKELTVKLEKLKTVLLKKNANSATELLKLSRKIPPKEALDSMDAYDRCELKLEIITSVMNFLESNELFGAPSVKDRASVTSHDVVGKRQSVLVSVGRDTYQNILKERLSLSKFDGGYVLQTLSNDFLRNEVTTMKILLEATGNVKMRLLVTFYKQPGSCDYEDYRMNDEKFCNDSSELSYKVLTDYQNDLTKLVETISSWEKGSPEPSKSAKGKDKSELLSNSLTNLSESFSIWHINISKNKQAYDAMILQLKSIASYLEDKNESTPYVPESKTFSILREYKNESIPADIFLLSMLDANNEDQSLEPHWILSPRKSQKFKVNFQASKSGRYESEFFLILLDNPAATFKISVEGVADIPRLDFTPIAIFNAVKDTKLSDVHEPCYFLDTEVYDFGCLLVLSGDKFHKRSTQFKFKNISAVPANVSFSLASESYDCFNICPRKIEIQPSETVEIEVTACSSNIGSNNDTIIVTTENNDQPLRINVKSTGVKMHVEVEPQHLDLGRIILGRIERHALTLRNHSAVTIHWHLTCDSEISFIPSNGKIRARGNCDIELQYFASKVGSNTTFFNVAWCLTEDHNNPITVDNVAVTAETYEILYDVTLERSIDLGNVPVGTTANKSFTVKNLGPYKFEFCISRSEETVLKKGAEFDFQCYPLTGLVLPKKQIDITIVYNPTIEFKVQSGSFFNLDIIEPYKNIGIIGTSNIKVSAISFFTKFIIEPYPNINFGTMALNSTKSMRLKIKNIGKFPLIYAIATQTSSNQLQPEALQRDSISKKARKSVQSEKATNKRVSSMANFRLKCGPFSLDKFQGDLDVDKAEDINVQCSSDVIGNFEEKLSVTVKNSKEIREINLSAHVRVAEIDFQDYETIFAGSHVVATTKELELLNEPNPHTVYSVAEHCLYFRRVCVGGQQVATVTLKNVGLIEGDVSIEVTDKTFKLDVNKLNIPAMSRQTFSVIFAPDRIDNFTSSLKITLDLPSTLETESLTIDLVGEGFVPQISIIDPTADDGGVFTLDFGLSYVCEWQEKLIQIKNVSEISAKVVIEAIDDQNENCQARFENENRLVCGCVGDENDARKPTFTIEPCEIQQIKVNFFPVKCGKYDNCLKIFVKNNPYEIFEVKVKGEGFCKPIVLENLEIIDALPIQNSYRASKQKSQKRLSLTRSSSKILNPPPLTYKLDYGKCFLNKAYKINFKITNKTIDRYYRFQWASCQNITCSPVAGHVMPDSFKEITATFIAYEPTLSSHLPLDCTIHEIILSQVSISCVWDTRQTEVMWTKNSRSLNECDTFDEEEVYFKKLVTESREPAYNLVPESLQIMQLLVSAAADYSDYDCDVNCINFDDTLMFQTKEHKIKLKNPSSVNLNYTWEITMDECYPIRLDQLPLRRTDSTESEPAPPPNSQTPLKKTVDICTPVSQQLSDLFSSSAGMTNRSTDSWIEGDNWPFEIVPESGSIAPDDVIECTLKFKPLDVFKYKAYLWCRMENLNPRRDPLNIVVTATSLLPYCHFEIEPSDYLDNRDIHLPLPIGYSLADMTRVVEYRVISVEQCHARSLYLINPTTEDYSFRWSRLSIEDDDNPFVMQCSQENGFVERGKRTRTTFILAPKRVGTFETFWTFEIDKYDLKVLFLIVAHVCEPSVTCKNTLLKLPTATIGDVRTATFKMTNNETCCLKFWVDENSMFSDGRLQRIIVCPSTCVLKPNACQIFCVEYKASLIGEHNFKVLCYVEKLKEPMKISIIVQVKNVLTTIVYTNSEGLEIKLDESSDNKIDFSGFLLNTSTRLPFKIINSGELPFDYQWNLSTRDQDKLKICLSESRGTVEPDTHELCYLEVTAVQKIKICNYNINLEIKSGPIYRIKLNSEAQNPPLEFSFEHYDFGPCYIFERGTSKLNTVDLFITNHQKIPCIVKCNSVGSAHLSLNLEEIARAIPPNDSVRVIVNFTPDSESFYEETLNFYSMLADGPAQNNIRIQGEGIAYKIRLKYPCDALLDFGNVRLGKSTSRKITVVNAGRLPVRLRPVVKGIADAMKFVNVSPNAVKDLKPSRELTVTVVLKGIQRIKSLQAEVGFELDGADSVLLTTLRANCVGADIRLNRECISFGVVYEGCTAEEKLVLINDGDVGSRFSWNVDKTKSGFSISPTCGFSSPGREVIFVCYYDPSDHCQTKAILELEELENLSIDLLASTCQLPEAREIINFKTEIQQSQTREISIFNDSNQRWHLRPKISGDHFASTATLSVDSKTSEIYIITYDPKKLTTQETIDEGKLIIPLPDGRQPLVYSLQGRCAPATISQKLIRTVPCKKKHIENLLIYNNTDSTRTYDSLVERDNKRVDCGIAKVRVPANSSKRCKLPLYFEEPGKFSYKVTFRDNQDNCQYFEIDYAVSSPEIESSIDLVTFVRASAFASLRIGNPSRDEVSTFDGVCSSRDVVLHGLPSVLRPLAYKNVRIEYRPLTPRDGTASLEIASSSLGSVFHELRLTAKPAPPEPTTRVTARLGGCADFSLTIRNHSTEPAQFSLEAGEASFACPSPVHVAASDERVVRINFEPHGLESVSTTIRASSDTAGEFAFPIVGQCVPPQPQGPFLASARAPACIDFKNVFLEPTTFRLAVDNPAFALDADQLTLDAKQVRARTAGTPGPPPEQAYEDAGVTLQSTRIAVRVADCERALETGRLLLLTCASSAKWTYYLRAERD
ncbi:hydrocephalus-inducing protein homolog [Phymastichus coffea]|uniref:hydrocephalus-inducing protein homolog n=1 Tax=Phymastichus coffea TaxID=108790 RepID=UPI00273BE669|nr:hydrocephalus-inducing protein homolog [Phymastichus coffea]